MSFAIKARLRRPDQLGKKQQEIGGSRAVTLFFIEKHFTDEGAQTRSATARGSSETTLVPGH